MALEYDKVNFKYCFIISRNYSLLSFGIEAEEEEEEIDSLNERFSAKGKSSHDLTSDPKLSSEAVEVDPTKKRDKDKPTKQESESDKEQNSEDDSLPAAELARFVCYFVESLMVFFVDNLSLKLNFVVVGVA